MLEKREERDNLREIVSDCPDWEENPATINDVLELLDLADRYERELQEYRERFGPLSEYPEDGYPTP